MSQHWNGKSFGIIRNYVVATLDVRHCLNGSIPQQSPSRAGSYAPTRAAHRRQHERFRADLRRAYGVIHDYAPADEDVKLLERVVQTGKDPMRVCLGSRAGRFAHPRLVVRFATGAPGSSHRTPLAIRSHIS